MSLTNKVTKDDILRISGANVSKCMQCGKCSGACPEYDNMQYHPHQFASMVKKGRIEQLMNSDAVYKCLSCFACTERCPRGVEPSRLIEAVRVSVIRQKGMNYMKPDDLPSKLDDEMPQQALVSAMRKYNR